MVMHEQEVNQGGLNNALENGARWLRLTVRVGLGIVEEEDEGEGMDAGTW
jgi:hypothetical protein